MITIEKADKIFLSLHKRLKSGEITESGYEARLNIMQKEFPEFIVEHFGFRSDKVNSRTLGQFGIYLLNNARIEKFDAEWWFENHAVNYFRNYESNRCIGVDQSGVLLCEVSENLDYEILYPKTIIEVKDCAIAMIGDKMLHKATYKKSSIDACVKRNAYLLTVFRKRGDSIKVGYSIANPQQLQTIQKECVFEQRHEMGGKLCCQFFLPECEVRKQYGSHDMSPNAKSLEKYMGIYRG